MTIDSQIFGSRFITYLLLCILWQAGTAQTETSVKGIPFVLGTPALVMQLPDKVTPMEVDVPIDMVNSLKSIEAYRMYFAEGNLVGVFKYMQLNKKIETDAAGLLTNEMNKLFKGIKAENVLQDDKDAVINKIHGRKAMGSFTIDKLPWTFQEIVLKSETCMWHIWIAAADSDPAYKTMMNSIFRSIHF